MSEQVIVLYDYNKKEQDELTLRKGDVITVSEKHDDGWWKGTNNQGEHGAFPENYVKVLAPGELPPQPEPEMQHKKDDVEELMVEVDERDEVKANKENVPRRQLKLSGMVTSILEVTYVSLLVLTLIFAVPLLASHDGQVPWSTGENSVDGTTITGWAGLLYWRQFSSRTEGLIALISYDSDQCETTLDKDTCDKCNEAGKAVLSFVVLAFFLLLVSSTFVGMRLAGLANEGIGQILASRMVTGIVNGMIALFYFFQWAVWAGGCNAHLQDDNKIKDFDTVLAAGWSLSFLSFIAMSSVVTIDGLLLISGRNKDGADDNNVKPSVGPSADAAAGNADEDHGYDVKGKMKGDHNALPTNAANAKAEDYEGGAGAPGHVPHHIPEEAKKEPVVANEVDPVEVQEEGEEAEDHGVPTNTFGGPSVVEETGGDSVENKIVAV
uniref:SH3 domain-containing protein n=1 Tax=Lotharella oceanica TaxID=641309 RepID=A0A7S2TNM1_9EUKA|eukprot:CAMPEP_0170176748 /NCGR_PEP_ID=MMETSP0040_2-20121228/9551_1 /TAXON_ID=641309 /ORGANISM="Lotharella oceanica, Strain CCMP622" /LENGTH=437 /DNA_ID=CAMNT_0010419167 /DNA_START=1 /DNA_END=1314 /DNA_ORIENTATION=-